MRYVFLMMIESFFNDGEVIDFLVASDVINKAAEILLTLIGMNFPADFGEESFRDWKISSADLLIFNANILITNVLVVAENGKAFRENNDGVSFNNISLGFVFCCFIKLISIIFVGNSWRAIVDNFNFCEDTGIFNIYV
jgi:hypothetical protein